MKSVLGIQFRCPRVLLVLLGLCGALTAMPLRASPVLAGLNGVATAPARTYTISNIGWTLRVGQNMLLDGLYSTFGRVPATTSLGPVLPRRVQVSVF